MGPGFSGDSPNTSTTTTNERLWTSTLPNEILSNIFSRISKADCIECLRVCRCWNASIPEYAQDVWQSVSIPSKTLAGSLPRFLGPHVKEAVLMSFEAVHLLEELMGRCQSIRVLDIMFSNHFNPTNHSRMISLLPVHSLSTLILRNVNISNIDLIATVIQCSSLLHLSYTARKLGRNEQDNGSRPLLTSIALSDSDLPLQTLYFEGNSTPQQAHLLMELLRHAPDLCALAIATVVGLDTKELRKTIKRCPKLEYFSSDVIESWSHGVTISNIHALPSKQAEEGRGLRTLGLFDANSITYFTLPYILMIKEHQDTLEHLLMGVDFDPDTEYLSQITHTLANIHLHRLKSFSWSSEYFPCFAFTSMLSQCQSLCDFRLTTWSSLDTSLCRTLAQLPSLESIRFCFKNDHMNSTAHNLYEFFEAICQKGDASRLSTVELSLFGWDERGDDTFPFLEPLAAIKSLRRVVLFGFIIIDDDTMLAFTKNLGGTRIEDVEIRWLIGLPDEALGNLCKLQHLRRLNLLHCRLPSLNNLTTLGCMARGSKVFQQVTVCDCDDCHEDDEYDIKEILAQGSMDWLKMVDQPF